MVSSQSIQRKKKLWKFEIDNNLVFVVVITYKDHGFTCISFLAFGPITRLIHSSHLLINQKKIWFLRKKQ